MKSIKAPEGGVYRQEFYKCNKERCKKCRDGPGHGPYWSRYWWEDGRTRKQYIGKNLPLTKDTGEEGPPLTKDRALPKILTKDKPAPKPLPKTSRPLTKDKLTKDKPSLPKTRQRALPKTDEGTVEKALAAILDFHNRGIEPLVQDIAAIVGMESRPLGQLLKAAGIENVVCRRDGKQARRYTLELKPKIEEVLKSGELEK
jgi:hypothetical protein